MGHAGNLLRGAVDSKGDLKDAALQVGIKLDLVCWLTPLEVDSRRSDH